eukprot:2684196-Alexandrium_andersonii.AAC.1
MASSWRSGGPYARGAPPETWTRGLRWWTGPSGEVGPPLPAGLDAALRSHHSPPCPLFGLGERSGEHLAAWCPA